MTPPAFQSRPHGRPPVCRYAGPQSPLLFFLRLFLALRLLVARRLLRGLQLAHARLQTRHHALERGDLALERDDLGGRGVQPLPRLERVLAHELLQEIDVALQATCALVEPGGLGAVLDSRDILSARETATGDEEPQGQNCARDHAEPRCWNYWIFLHWVRSAKMQLLASRRRTWLGSVRFPKAQFRPFAHRVRFHKFQVHRPTRLSMSNSRIRSRGAWRPSFDQLPPPSEGWAER